MSPPEIIVTPAVNADLDLIFDWYEIKEPGLGWRFIDEFYGAIEALALQAQVTSWRHSFPKIILPSFPYYVFFVPAPHTLTILLVTHTSRSPDRMREELAKRGKNG